MSGIAEDACHDTEGLDDVEEDFLDEMIRESTTRSPEFHRLMERAQRNRESFRHVGE